MSGPPEPYVPGRPLPPDEEGVDAWSPEIYVPPPGPSRGAVSGRVRAALRGADDEDPSPGRVEPRLYRLMRDPDLWDAALGCLEAELRDREVDAVAGAGPRGWLLAAPLADRTGRPLLALDGTGVLGGPPPEAPVLLVDLLLEPRDELAEAARRLEAAGGEVAGVAVLAAAAAAPDETMADYNLFVFTTLQ